MYGRLISRHWRRHTHKCLDLFCWQVGARQAQAGGSGSPHGMRASGTGYRVRSIAACLWRTSRTRVPPRPQEPLRAIPSGRQRDVLTPQQATQASVNRDWTGSATATAPATGARDCALDCDINRHLNSWLLTPHSSRGPSTSQYSLMALTLQPRRPGYAFPRRIMHDIEGRTGSEANATLLPCASNATGHFPACCSSCHLRRCHSSRLISSHLVSFDSLLLHSAHI